MRGELRRRFRQAASSEFFWLLTALALRAGFAWLLGDRFYQADENGFDNAARSLARHGSYAGGGAPLVGAPLTSLFISGFYAFGHSVRAARLGQAVLSAGTAWLIGRMTADLAGSRRAGLFALAVSAVYPFFIYYSGMLMSETLYLALTVSGFWALCRGLAERGSRPGRLAAAGAALGAAGLTRTEAVPIALGLWIFLGGLCLARRMRWTSWSLAVVLWALPLGGWMARNKGVCGAYILDAHGGITLLHGSLLFDENEIDTGEAQRRLETLPLYAEGQRLDELRRDRLYAAAAWRHMRDDPSRTLRQWGRKFINFWRLIPRQDKVYADTSGAKPHLGLQRLTLAAVSLACEPLLLGLGLWGAWLFRRRFWELFPLYWMVAASCAIHVVVVSQMRYRLALMPIFILFACAAADRRLGGRD